MIGFTFIAIGIFLATFIHQIQTNSLNAGLPNIDSSLLVLMGVSQGGYLGKKLVSVVTPGAGAAVTQQIVSATTAAPATAPPAVVPDPGSPAPPVATP